jgi:hypothetical protein
MNAVLAKPIHAIWFIHARPLICVNRLLQRFSVICGRGCATIRRCPIWSKIAATHNQKTSTRDALSRERDGALEQQFWLRRPCPGYCKPAPDCSALRRAR